MSTYLVLVRGLPGKFHVLQAYQTPRKVMPRVRDRVSKPLSTGYPGLPWILPMIEPARPSPRAQSSTQLDDLEIYEKTRTTPVSPM